MDFTDRLNFALQESEKLPSDDVWNQPKKWKSRHAIPDDMIQYITKFEWGPDRAKVTGRMYGGQGEAVLPNGVKLKLKLWHHGGDNMTDQEAKEQSVINAINVNGRYYDAAWYTIIRDDGIWLNEEGWFGFDEKKTALKEVAEWYRHDRLNPMTADGAAELEKWGFKKIA